MFVLRAQKNVLACCAKIQVRSLFILEREFPLRQPQEGEAHKNLNTPRMRTYRVVDQLDTGKLPPMKIVLKEYIEGVGYKGDVVDVSPWKGRFNYILSGKAEYPTPEALKWAEEYRIANPDRQVFSSENVPWLLRNLQKRLFTLDMSEVTPWTLEAWHVRTALRGQGVAVPLDSIYLPPEPIQSSANVFNKQIAVGLKINKTEDCQLRFLIRSSEKTLDLTASLAETNADWFLEPPVPLLESQAEEIQNLHESVVKFIEAKRNKIR